MGFAHRDLKPENLMINMPTPELTPTVQIKIVDFGLAQLTATGCNKKFVRVENFGEQVVAGTLYHFEVVRKCDGGDESVCHMKVLDVPWQGGKQVLWGKTTCK